MHVRVRGAIAIAAAISVPGLVLAQPKGKPDDGPDEIELEGERATAPDQPGQAAPARAAPRVLELPDPVEHPSLPQVVAPARGFAWEPFGYLRLQYVAAQNDPNVAFVGRDDGFELQNARIGVRGTLDARAAFVISIDGAVDERVQINVPEGKLRVGLRDAYADVALARRLVARAGYFQPIVDPQALIPDPSRAFVDRPLESRGVRATEGFETQGLTPGRSIGAALRLDPGAAVTSPAVGFELAVQNGADEFTSNNDNDKPAVSATLLARLPRDGWLFVAGRYNARSLGDLPARRDENDLQASAGFQINAGPLSFGGGGIVQRTTFPSTQGPVQNAFGAHAQLLLRTGVMVPFAFGYRFGILDPSSLLTTDRVMEHTAAAVLGVRSYRMRLQLQLVHVVEQRALSNSRAQLAVEVAL